MAETILNRRIVMASRPTGMPSLENFSMEEVEEPYDAPDGGVLLVMTTHEGPASAVTTAIDALADSENLVGAPMVMPILDI